MNTLVIAIITVVWLIAGYKIYGNIIQKKLVEPLDRKITPAHTMEDGVDYDPGSLLFVWGNHFASIAGAGPIIGPILAVSIFGWGPTLLWVALGSVLLGAVHDYLCLIISVRNNGRSVASLSGTALGPSVKFVFSLLIYFMLLLLVTVFMVSVAQALVHMPALVIPTFGLIAVAMLMGLAAHTLGINEIVCACLGIITAYILIWVGYTYPVSFPATWSKEMVLACWFVIISLYCLSASISPMWLILRPRDFISSVKLIVGMLLGFIGIIVIHPSMQAPCWQGGFISHDKPIWPMLFIMVACGAISGFHSIVATGTTSRQLSRERDAMAVGFGGMVAEGAVALLVILVVGGGLKWGFAPKEITGLAANNYFGTALAQNWIVAFGQGFGNVVGSLNIPYLTAPIAALLGAVMVKSFILTTLDTGTRLGRFLITDTLGHKAAFLNNRVVASLVLLLPAFILAVTNSWQNVWKLFGTANQLTAAIALLTITAILAKLKKPIYFTLAPAMFMVATTLAALIWECFGTNGFLTGKNPDYLLGVVVIILASLAVFAFFRVFTAFSSTVKQK